MPTIFPGTSVPVINTSGCTGCGRCVGTCPLHLLSLEAKNWVKSAVIHAVEKCTGCGKCKTICPFNAIQMRRHDKYPHE